MGIWFKLPLNHMIWNNEEIEKMLKGNANYDTKEKSEEEKNLHPFLAFIVSIFYS